MKVHSATHGERKAREEHHEDPPKSTPTWPFGGTLLEYPCGPTHACFMKRHGLSIPKGWRITALGYYRTIHIAQFSVFLIHSGVVTCSMEKQAYTLYICHKHAAEANSTWEDDSLIDYLFIIIITIFLQFTFGYSLDIKKKKKIEVQNLHSNIDVYFWILGVWN